MHKLVFYADDVNLLNESMSNIKENCRMEKDRDQWRRIAQEAKAHIGL